MKKVRALNTLFALLLVASTLLGQAKPAFADLVLQSQVSIRPANMSDLSLTSFTDNLTSANEHYVGDDPIIFKILVTNTGAEVMKNITVTDTIPDYLMPHRPGMSGWNETSRTVTYQIDFLSPNKFHDYMIPMKVLANDDIPGAPRTMCLTNSAQITSGSSNARDASTFCVEKLPPTNPATTVTPAAAQPATAQPSPTVVPTTTPTATSEAHIEPTITQIPSTGPEAGALMIGLELLALGTGVVLKRRVS